MNKASCCYDSFGVKANRSFQIKNTAYILMTITGARCCPLLPLLFLPPLLLRFLLLINFTNSME